MPIYDVITLADTCIDILVSGDDVTPAFGQAEKLVDNYTLELGGSGCLFAAQAAKLGLKVGVLGKVGADAFGTLLIDKLQTAGVDTRFIRVDPALKTGITVHLTPSGSSDRAMLTVLGSLASLTPEDVTDDFLQSARHFHYSSLFLHTGLLPIWVNIVQRAKHFGLTASLDTNFDPTERWDDGLPDALALFDIFMPNFTELCRILRHDDAQDAISAYRAANRGLLALKAGEEGAYLHTDHGTLECHPSPADPGGDSTGAGDAFDAGFLAGWLAHLPLETCLQIGCECGRSVAGKVGGYAGQLWRREIAALKAE